MTIRRFIVVFAVLVASAARGQFAGSVHVVTPATLVAPTLTALDVSWASSTAAGHLFTPLWNPPGQAGVYVDDWLVSGLLAGPPIRPILESHDPLPLGAAFNVLSLLGFSESCRLVHVTNAASVSGNVSLISHPALDGRPGARLIVSEAWHGVAPRVPIGVYYEPVHGKWGIFNQDLSPMGVNRYFSILSPDCAAPWFARASVECASPVGNTCPLGSVGAGRHTARLLVTPRWEGVYNPHPIGVYYTGSGWAVFNQDLATMPAGAIFDIVEVLVLLQDGFETGDLSGWTSAVGEVP